MTDDERAEPWILLTNDDGADSPALPPLMRELGAFARVKTLVPASECSWTSKMVSRFTPLEMAEKTNAGMSINTLSGFPADCANVGINNICPSTPAIVVSGINVGTNAGSAYFLSSGTVGAAIEGMLNSLPAIAISLEIESDQYARWRQSRDLSGMAEKWDEAAVVAAEIVRESMANGLPEGASMMTVNMPPDVTVTTPRRLTGLTETRYGALFRREEETGHFRHSFDGVRQINDSAGGDMEALGRGQVAMTPIHFSLDVKPTAVDQRRFERN